MELENAIITYLENIIGSPTNDYESLCLYVVSCFIFIIAIKFVYGFISYLLGIKR